MIELRQWLCPGRNLDPDQFTVERQVFSKVCKVYEIPKGKVPWRLHRVAGLVLVSAADCKNEVGTVALSASPQRSDVERVLAVENSDAVIAAIHGLIPSWAG